jgi:hypothetical protein
MADHGIPARVAVYREFHIVVSTTQPFMPMQGLQEGLRVIGRDPALDCDQAGPS